MKAYRDRQLIATALATAIEHGLDDDRLVADARQIIRTSPNAASADTYARTARVLRQLRSFNAR
jgi:putative intracellular protease/amidase